ncbi:pseudouridine synthase [Clostridium grantii]|uniref:Pseudouridine synthase n=1 Tax=Clostridium grantii DSM 8605 TaxID=1121316 RepID=A0A1M5XF54_9CLOT|nr:16S rRNA pseudouridine(516) synthase [Clostridium grantii]SHH98134.1 ribosomal small subunit pseudouridine synthase A [Clostridium grantii DSM 8605]
MERLDKVLANLGYGSRKEIRKIAKNGEIEVDGKIIKDFSMKVDPYNSEIKVAGEKIFYREYVYILMNKPDGVVSATVDNYDETVIDLLSPELQVFNPAPVGRLDKDTVGLLFLTNDGDLNHRLTSPKHHVDKVYYAEIDKSVDEEDIEVFKNGVTLEDGYECLPAKLEIINANEHGSEILLTISEGKFHQVKRMFKAREKEVVFLKRVKMGPLELDDSLDEGTFRELTEEEVKVLKAI